LNCFDSTMANLGGLTKHHPHHGGGSSR
jgi:hypothetical protein